MEKVKLRFYEIDRCGYYKDGSDLGHLTNIANTLEELKKWSATKTLEQTKTIDALASKKEKLPAYCLSVNKGAQDTYLLATWNQIESTNGRISSINRHVPTKDAVSKLQSTKLPKDSIPGFTTYFWFLPKENLYATVRLNHVENGNLAMNYLIKGFLTAFTSYTYKTKNRHNKLKKEIIGYGTSKVTADDNLYPYFNTNLKRLNGKVSYIKKNISSIKKVHRRLSLSHTQKAEKKLYDGAFNLLGLDTPQKAKIIDTEYSLKVHPSPQQVDDIIDNWEKDLENSWDDIGFTFKGKSGSPMWLSTSIANDIIELNIVRENDEFVDAKHLLNLLESNLDRFKKVYNGEN